MSQEIKEWHVKLRVSFEEERSIKKAAIDHNLKVAEYIKRKTLTDAPILIEGKSS